MTITYTNIIKTEGGRSKVFGPSGRREEKDLQHMRRKPLEQFGDVEYVLPLNGGPMDKHREVRRVKRRPKRPTDEQAMLIAKAGL